MYKSPQKSPFVLLSRPFVASLLSFIEDLPPMGPHRAVGAADVGIGREHGDAQTTTRSQEVLGDTGFHHEKTVISWEFVHIFNGKMEISLDSPKMGMGSSTRSNKQN